MKALKKILTIVLRIGTSVALLLLVFRKVDTANLYAILKNAHFADIVIAFLVFLSAYFLCLFRWEMLLKGAQINLPLRRVIISFGGGVFFNLFMPSTIGGDMVRSIDLSKHTQKPKEIIATVILDRLSGFVGLVIVAIIALFFGWKYVREPSVLISLSIITAVLLMLILLIFNRALYIRINRFLSVPFSSSGSRAGQLMNKLKDGLGKLHQEMHDFKSQKKLIWGNLFMSLLIQLSLPVVFYLLAKALNIEVDLVYFFIFLPIISAITMLPISIGGLGLRDATTVFFFAKAGVAKDLAFAMSLLNFSFILITACAGGLIYVFGVRHRRL